MNQYEIFEIINLFTGNKNSILIPNLLVKRLEGDYTTAAFLSQLMYWYDKGAEGYGWVYKTYKEWEEEIYVNERTLRRIKNKLEEKNLIETKRTRIHGQNRLYYRMTL